MKIVAVKKDEDGDIWQYKLDDGRVVDKEQAMSMVDNNELEDYNIGTSRSGSKYIRNNPDGDESNNLDKLPEF